jgi:hypothetical protein
LLVILLAGIVFWIFNSAKQQPVSNQFQNTGLDLTDIANSDFKDTDEFSILGQLNINGGFAIKPTSQPATPDPGQIYYDQDSNVLSYYNGNQFIELTGDLNVGNGIDNTDGVLTNSGVLSVQGQTGDVTLTAGNGITISGTTITATNGGVGGSGTAGKLVKFTGAQTIGDSILTESGTTVSLGGSLNITGGVSLGTVLTVANGGTGTGSLTANGVLIGNGTGAITSVTAAGSGLCLQSTVGAPAFSACPGGGGGVTSLNGLSGALTLANASGLGSTVTINNASTVAKGIASFDSTNFSVTSGAVDTIQDIATTSSPTFVGMTLTGDLAVNGNDITSTGALNLTSGGGANIVLDPAGDFRVAGGSDSNTLYVKSSGDSVGVGTNNPGFKLEVNGTLGISGLTTLTSLGTANTSSYLCRNGSNQIATCSASGAGVSFVNGGNSFGGGAVLGTNDSNSLSFETDNTTQARIATGGAVTFQNSSDSTSAFRVLASNASFGSGVPIFQIDTQNGYVYIGNPSADSTGALLVLDTKNTTGDPTGVAGGMYYNSALGVSRCYIDGYWRDCVDNERTAYNYVNDFVKVPSSSPYDDTITISGEYFAITSGTFEAGHPGIMNFAASTNGNKTMIFSGSGFDDSIVFGNGLTWRYEEMAMIKNTLSDSSDRYVFAAGFFAATDTISGITNGCYFRYSDDINSGNWQGVCEDGTESTCDTGVAATIDTWVRLTVVANDAANSVDFMVNGASACTITTHIPSTSSTMSFGTLINKTNGNGFRGVYLDYISAHAQFSSAR